ncbi:MAG: VOC family protein [Polyangiaceae bacterium]
MPYQPQPNRVAHFAIHADDVERAKRFYEQVFGWSVSPWGPPGFYSIGEEGAGIRGAIQERRSFGPDKPMHGFECTVAVADVDAVAAAVVEAGGRVVMDKAVIAGVGELIFFEDSEGNVAGAMRYDPTIE